MAPSATTTTTETATEVRTVLKPLVLSQVSASPYKDIDAYRGPVSSEAEKTGDSPARYPNYLPVWDHLETYASLEPFEHYDHGKDADPTYPELLGESVQVTQLTPQAGSELRGVQISKLSKAGLDQLARYVAERKVVAFRDQDFADLPIDKALEIGGYFGRHHIHPTSGAPEGFPQVHIVHRPEGDNLATTFYEHRTSSIAWHSDVSYEQQPPGTTFLYALDIPETGGDTLFADAAAAYERLSPLFQERLHGLEATHSAVEQANNSVLRGGVKRREPVRNVHPIVRTHPVTGQKALFVNPQFTREIVGLKREESDAILKFLYDHLAQGADFHVRVKWEKGTVVIWDNRVTQHSAIIDWKTGERRHLARITPQAERPFATPFVKKE